MTAAYRAGAIASGYASAFEGNAHKILRTGDECTGIIETPSVAAALGRLAADIAAGRIADALAAGITGLARAASQGARRCKTLSQNAALTTATANVTNFFAGGRTGAIGIAVLSFRTDEIAAWIGFANAPRTALTGRALDGIAAIVANLAHSGIACGNALKD